MDIEEAKKFARNKIKSDSITKQVRDIIKITKWQKQDMREGFKETFQPLLESNESIKKSIDEQQNETIAQLKKNQLALTQGLNQNRMVITEGLENLLYQDSEGEAQSRKIDKSYFNKYLDNEKTTDILKDYGYDNLPSDFLEKDIISINKIIDDINKILYLLYPDLKKNASLINNNEDYSLFEPKSKDLKTETLKDIDTFNALSIYRKNLLKIKNYKEVTGSGITLFNNQNNIIERLKLLDSSIIDFNNGLISEFSKLVNILKQMNDLIKNLYKY